MKRAISERSCKIIRYFVRDLPVFLADTEVFFKLYHGHKKRKDGSLSVSYDYDGTCVLSERYWHCPAKLRFSVLWIVVIQFEYLGKCICSKFTTSPEYPCRMNLFIYLVKRAWVWYKTV